MSLSDLKDQEVPRRLLRNILQQNRVPNGLLFWGPEGVGKQFAAIELAKALNCTEGKGDACDQCLSCRKIMSGNHPDVKIVAPSGKVRNINVDTIDFITELSAYRPFQSEWRIVIVQDADRMRADAQNHFLKTLEEPPSKTAFILQTAFPQHLLPTIRSRCQAVRFGSLQPATVARILQREHSLDDKAAHAIALVSQGQASRALDLVTTNKRESVLDMAARLRAGEDPLLRSGVFVSHLKEHMDNLKSSLKSELESGATDEGTREDLEDQKKEQDAYIEGQVRRDYLEYLYLFETWYRDAWVFDVTRDEERLLNRDQAAALAQYAGQEHSAKITAIEKAWVYIERNLSIDRVFRDLFFALAA
ncbi:MAG: DNA polymerase III subunit delta' [Candidatus Hydrogenedentes bacterium]|nr:DNA polymerase III subunit delta' [Candidatus Hydrogenedentota bacterium]